MEIIFDFFLPETYFSTNVSFQVVEKDFLASRNHKLLFRIVEKYFVTNPSFLLLEQDFLLSENRLLYLRVFSY